MGAAPRCGQAPVLGQPVPGGLAVLLARAPLTCPGAPPPPPQSPARAHPPPVYLPRGCLAHPARPQWMRVVPRHPLAGHWVIGIYTLLQGAKGAERGFPQTASSSQWREFGVGEQATPWPPCPGGWAACSASGPGSSLALGTPGPLHFALSGGRLPWGPTLTSSGQKGRVSPAEGVQQGPCPPCSSPAIFRCLARRLPGVKGPREVSAGRRGEVPCLPSATSFLS